MGFYIKGIHPHLSSMLTEVTKITAKFDEWTKIDWAYKTTGEK